MTTLTDTSVDPEYSTFSAKARPSIRECQAALHLESNPSAWRHLREFLAQQLDEENAWDISFSIQTNQPILKRIEETLAQHCAAHDIARNVPTEIVTRALHRIIANDKGMQRRKKKMSLQQASDDSSSNALVSGVKRQRSNDGGEQGFASSIRREMSTLTTAGKQLAVIERELEMLELEAEELALDKRIVANKKRRLELELALMRDDEESQSEPEFIPMKDEEEFECED